MQKEKRLKMMTKKKLEMVIEAFKDYLLYFDLRLGPKILFQGNTPEGSDTFQKPVIESNRNYFFSLDFREWNKRKKAWPTPKFYG